MRPTRGFLMAACVLWTVAALATGAVEEVPRPRGLAVLNFTNRNPGDGWDWLGRSLADMLITDLSRSQRLRVVERERLSWMLAELELGERGLLDPTAAAGVGRICKVELALCGSYSVAAGRIQIEGHMVEVATARLLRVEQVEGANEELFTLEKKLAYQILERMDIALSEEERRSILYVPTDSLDALAHYGHGLEAYDDGDYARAVMEFRLALKRDKDFYKATMHLAKLYFAMGEHAHALVDYRQLLGKNPGAQLTESAYLQMGQVLALGLGRYREALACYEEIVKHHPEYEVNREQVQQHLTLFRPILRQNSSADRAERDAASKALDGLANRRRTMEEQNAAANHALAQMGWCYEKLGDTLNAARCYVQLLNFLQVHYADAISPAGDDLPNIASRKAVGFVTGKAWVVGLYEYVLLEGLDDRISPPGSMVVVPEGGGEIAGTATSYLPGLVCVAPPGREFTRVSLTPEGITDPAEARFRAPDVLRFGPGSDFHKFNISSAELVGVRGLRVSCTVNWRMKVELGPYRKQQALAMHEQRQRYSQCDVMAIPGQVRLVYIDGQPLDVNLGWYSQQINPPVGEHEVRVVWSDGSERSQPFVTEPGQQTKFTVMRDCPFTKALRPVAASGEHPNLLFDRDGKLWVCWDDLAGPGDVDLFYSTSADGGRTWTEPRALPVSTPGLDRRPVLRQDRLGTYWLVWMSDRDLRQPNALWISSSLDALHWSYPSMLRLPVPGSDGKDTTRKDAREDFSFAISPRNVFYVADGGWVWRSDDGRRWDAPAPTGLMPGGGYRLHAGYQGLTLVAVRKGQVLLAQSEDGVKWTEPEHICTVQGQEAALEKDADGNAVLLEGAGMGCHVKKAGGPWSGPLPFESYLVEPQQPDVAVSLQGRWVAAYRSTNGIIAVVASGLFGQLARPHLALAPYEADLAAAAQPEHGGDRAVLVLPFDFGGDPDYRPVGEAMADVLTAELSRSGDVHLVDRRHLTQVLSEQELDLSGMTDSRQQAEVGRLTGARLLLGGTVTVIGDVVKVNAHLFDVAQSTVVGSEEAQGAVEGWLEVAGRLGQALCQRIGARPAEGAPGDTGEAARTNLCFIRALDHHYTGRYDEALMEFLHAIERDPDDAAAVFMMAENYLLDADYAHALVEYERFPDRFPRHALSKKAGEQAALCKKRMLEEGGPANEKRRTPVRTP